MAGEIATLFCQLPRPALGRSGLVSSAGFSGSTQNVNPDKGMAQDAGHGTDFMCPAITRSPNRDDETDAAAALCDRFARARVALCLAAQDLDDRASRSDFSRNRKCDKVSAQLAAPNGSRRFNAVFLGTHHQRISDHR